MKPPLCAMIPWTIDRPGPVPLPVSFVVKKGSKIPLTGTSSTGNRPFRHRKNRHDSVAIADIEEHSFGKFIGHVSWLEIDDK